MKTRTSLIALATLVAGTAFAQMPAAGEAPFFNDGVQASSTTREAVRAQVAGHFPAAGEQSVAKAAPQVNAEQLSRADVRQQTREAIAHGHAPATGERS
ncbi:MAG: hypothetical protein Q4G71_17675 [Pseudomonadota bacterium]|nr:hypothetical protein [Pseudomonadota bacterium]